MEIDQTLKQKKPKSRTISSRFLLSPSSNSSPFENNGLIIQSPNKNNLSPLIQKPRSSIDSRKHKSLENSSYFRGLWPSSSSAASPNEIPTRGETLADHLGNDRLIDLAAHPEKSSTMFLSKQRSCSEFSRFGNHKESTKENHKPLFSFTRKSSSSSKSPKMDDYNDKIIPPRLSVDEIVIRKRNSARKSDYLSDLQAETDSEKIPASYMAPTVSSRMSGSGIEVPSKYMQDSSSQSRRWSAENSPKRSSSSSSSFSLIKRSNSGSKLGLSPGRKPPTSPSRKTKAVGNLLTMGLELLKGKKSSSNPSSPLGPSMGENVHLQRLLHNRLMQWRYANAKAEIVNANICKQVQVCIVLLFLDLLY